MVFEQEISVLVVEDEVLVKQLICSQLARLGYQVVGAASDENEAHEMAKELRPNLILLDLQMINPTNGEEDSGAGLRAAQNIIDSCPTPIILLTAHETPELVRAASDIGIMGYLVKPVRDNELNRAILIAMARFEDTMNLRRLNQELAEMNANFEEEIQERKRMQQAEREQRIWAEALRDTGTVLNSTLDLTEVIDHILAYVGRVVPHDAANVMHIREGIAQTVGSHGYKERGFSERDHLFSVRVKDIPNYVRLIESKVPLVVTDTQKNDWVDFPITRWVRSYIGAPMIVKGKTIGFLNLDSATPGFFNEGHAERLQAFASQAAIAIDNARLYAEVQQLAIIDDLTGVYNRRGLMELGQREVERARRFIRPLGVLFVDIDHFKDINDQFTHAVGDEVLIELASRLRSEVREIDLVTRYGGEEFVILLPENDLETAWQVAERVRRRVSGRHFKTSCGKVSVSVSLGVTVGAADIPNLTPLIERADKAMYDAKRAGRNQVSVL
jgi:diguanylate cyclase (GGDEF)-like protein